MLVLTRNIDERVIITVPGGLSDPTVITVLVCDVRRQSGTDHARLGFEAPSHAIIDREEVHKSIQSKGKIKNAQGN